MSSTMKDFEEYLDFADPYYRAAHNGQPMTSDARAHLISILEATDSMFEELSDVSTSGNSVPREAYLNLASATYASLVSPDICLEAPIGHRFSQVTYMDFSDPQHVNQETTSMLAGMYHVATLLSNGQDWLDSIADREVFTNDKLAARMVMGLQSYIDGKVIKNALNAVDIDSDLLWSKTGIPIGVTKTDHYKGIAEMLWIGSSIICHRSDHQVVPNYAIIPPTLEDAMKVCTRFTPAVNHPDSDVYFFCDCAGCHIYTARTITDGSFLLGVNNPNYLTSALAFAPYLLIGPTDPLGIRALSNPEAGLSLSASFDYCVLNSSLLIKGQVPDATCSNPPDRLVDLTAKLAKWKRKSPRGNAKHRGRSKKQTK